ncbi:MAG: FtsQ-type POTRA domain-containing protein [Oscillospiraceae bacterium]|nr:FtsQ-type POTRA domain-containing protein [Oscillospiraceae bacterium]
MRRKKNKGAGDSQAPAPLSKRRRSAKRYAIHLTLFFIFAVASLITLSLTEFFLITSIQVEGNDRYSNTEVIEYSGINLQDNLFRINTKQACERISENYPYFETVKTKRILPDALVIQVTMAQPTIAIETETGYVLVSSQGKILETDVQNPSEKLLRVRGLEDWEYNTGSFITEFSEETQQVQEKLEKYEMLKSFEAALGSVQLSPINYIDLSDRYNIRALYDERILLELGSEAKLEYKLNFISEMLKENIPRDFGQDFEGTIDASFDKMLRVRPRDLTQILDERALDGDSNEEEEEFVYGSDMLPLMVPVRPGDDESDDADFEDFSPQNDADAEDEDVAVFESGVKTKDDEETE